MSEYKITCSIMDFLKETLPKFCTKKAYLLHTTITTDSMTSV